jgi:hypothetical protein
LALALVSTFGVPASAADYQLDTWTSGSGAATTYVFKSQGDTFVGAACGPCDDPATVVRIVGGTTTSPGHVSFSMIGGKGPSTTSTITLKHAGDDKTLVATVKSEPAPQAPQTPRLLLDGRWVAAGRTAQQNVTLKLRDDNKVWGVICGPCDKPEGVFLIDDGAFGGDAISFFIHHVENRRNFMKGVIAGNVMKFKWVREGQENEPGGEMTLIGPIR